MPAMASARKVSRVMNARHRRNGNSVNNQVWRGAENRGFTSVEARAVRWRPHYPASCRVRQRRASVILAS